jgi:predicted Zn-dependent peptidase
MQIAVDRYTLDNGLRVVLAEDHASPVVAVNLWYNVGSRNERPGRTGFAHLFEHMMFQGSENVPDTEHIAHIERVGRLDERLHLARPYQLLPDRARALARARRSGWSRTAWASCSPR